MKIRRPKKPLRSLVVGLALTVVALSVACGGPSAAPTVVVQASDYSFNIPASIEGGLTRISLTNVGQEPHHMQFMKLNDGVSQEQFQTVLDGVLEAIPTEGEAALFGLFQFVTVSGGPSVVNPGRTTDVVLDLEEGQYAFVCFLPSPDGVPHIAKGMVGKAEVTAAPETAFAQPKEDATVTLNDYAFTGVPATLSAGEATLKVVNAGQEPHEMVLARLDGVTSGQVAEMLMGPPPPEAPAGPPPFEFVGGSQALMPGDSGWVIVDLEPGEYGLICLIPSPPNDFTPHFALGMVNSITVK
ncbi:MAG: hypothetical protein O2821_13355 [Chloroflexi bacterium]|nr:hypothetical protein [Chloroflexota bacterium]